MTLSGERVRPEDLLTAEHSYPRPGVVVCALTGEVDALTAPLLTEAVWKAFSLASHVVLDLSRVTLLSSRGATALIEAAESRGGDRSLCLVAERPEIMRVLEVTGLTDLLPRFADRHAALLAGVALT